MEINSSQIAQNSNAMFQIMNEAQVTESEMAQKLALMSLSGQVQGQGSAAAGIALPGGQINLLA